MRVHLGYHLHGNSQTTSKKYRYGRLHAQHPLKIQPTGYLGANGYGGMSQRIEYCQILQLRCLVWRVTCSSISPRWEAFGWRRLGVDEDGDGEGLNKGSNESFVSDPFFKPITSSRTKNLDHHFQLLVEFLFAFKPHASKSAQAFP